MNYARLKQLPDFCYTCVNSCRPERHARALERKRKVQAKRRADLAAVGALCCTCGGPHDDERHERYKAKAAQRLRDRRAEEGYCSSCRGPHQRKRHEREAARRRKVHRWKRSRCDICTGKHERQRHRQRLHAEYARIAQLKAEGRWCSVCHGEHNDERHARYATRRQVTFAAWRRRNPRPRSARSHRLPQHLAPVAEQYPYARSNDVEIVAQVDALVSHGLPDDVRADVCQEILLALLEGREQLATLDVGRYVRNGYRQLTSWGDVSLYAPSAAYDGDFTLESHLANALANCLECGGPVIYAEGCKACGWRCGWSDC